MIVAHLPEDVSIAHGDKVIGLVDSALAREGQDALLGKQIIQLKFSQLDIEPGRAKNVVQSRHD